MIRKMFLAAAALMALTAAPMVAHAEQWMAAAVNDNGWGYSGSPFGGEESARSVAINACEGQTGYTCSFTVSVPTWWTLVTVMCPNGRSVGASKGGLNQAIRVASRKLGYSSCRLENNW